MMLNRSFQSKAGAKDLLKSGSAVLILLLLIVVNLLFTRNFASVDIIWTVIIQSTTVILTGLGMLLVISTGGIDISIGSVMGCAAIFNALFITRGGLPVWLSCTLAVLLCGAFGLVNGLMIGKLSLTPMVVTLAMQIGARGIAQVLNNGYIIFIDPSTGFSQLGIGKLVGKVPSQIIPVVIVAVLVAFFVKKTLWGRRIQAVGDNARAARLSGINATGMIISVYVACAMIAALAGLITSAKVSAADGNTLGKLSELDAIAAVAVGGTSMSGGRAKVLSTIAGALIVQLITLTFLMNNITFEYAQLIKSIVIITAVYIQRDRRA